MTRSSCIFVFGTAIAMCLPVSLVAEPLPGQFLKFQQHPMVATSLPTEPGVVFNGHNELSTAYSVIDPENGQLLGYRGHFMADDFADPFTTPVVHVRWWGSYLHQPTFLPDPFVRRFLISFERDIPQSETNPFSRPGEPILNQIVTRAPLLAPGSGTFTETVIPNSHSVDGPIYEYNAELHLGKEFRQEPDTVYWLKIVALVDRIPQLPLEEQLQWGWHNRDYTKRNTFASVAPDVEPGEHPQGFLPSFNNTTIPVWHFQDDAVDGFVNVIFDLSDPSTQIMPIVQQDVRGPKNYVAPWDGPSIIGQFSKDLAFELYSIPEPSCVILAVIALVTLGCSRRCRG